MATNWKLVSASALSVLCFNPHLLPGAASIGAPTAMAAHAYGPGESQPLVGAGDTYAIFPVGTGQVLAQTFAPATNEWLGYLQLPVGCSDGVLLNVKIREGLGGPIAFQVNIAGLPTIVDGSFQLIQVYDPDESKKGIKLKKGREYAFELAAFPGPAATGTTCAIAKGPSANSYAGGRGYFRDPVNGPTFLPLPNGVASDDEDLPFMTFVR